ncbi:unnamed protein product [Mesocestoides corti]|uniref:Uncharacterized protein n=1 Tax=Mesocestoides corti TaxID=53468 RepID=A0A0R3UMG2_MESCO|nr:unnamed protein product [Mesocestoides corti]
MHEGLNGKDLLYKVFLYYVLATSCISPFVSQVLRGAGAGIAFRPPSQWTIASLRVLRQMHLMRNASVQVKVLILHL